MIGYRALIITALVWCTFGLTMAASNIENFAVDNDNTFLNLSWNKASDDIMKNRQGYAVQWGGSLSDMNRSQPARIYLTTTYLPVRLNTFDRGEEYFFRVYTYNKIGRNRLLYNGSEIIKLNIDEFGALTTETLQAPQTNTITTTSEDTNSEAAKIAPEFTPLRVQVYDTFVDMYWSRPRSLAAVEYEGFVLQISKTNDFAELLGELYVSKGVLKGRFTGLLPSTEYFVRGLYYKGNSNDRQVFGDTNEHTIKTITAIDREASTKQARNLAKIEKAAFSSTDISSGTSSVVTNNSATTSSAKLTASEMRNKIKEINAQIKNLQSQLASWQNKLNALTGTKTKTTKATKKTSTQKTTANKKCRVLKNGRRLCFNR